MTIGLLERRPVMINSKKSVRNIAFIGLALIIIVIAPFITLGINLIRDLQGIDIIDISCLKFAKIRWVNNGGVLAHTNVCLDSGNSYGEVVRWFRSIGWHCDGGCEYRHEETIGPFSIHISKFLDPFPDRFNSDVIMQTQTPTLFDLYINYDLVLR